MPAHSGAPIADWIEKVTSWEAGWRAAMTERETTHGRETPMEVQDWRSRAQHEKAERKLELFCSHVRRGDCAAEVSDEPGLR